MDMRCALFYSHFLVKGEYIEFPRFEQHSIYISIRGYAANPFTIMLDMFWTLGYSCFSTFTDALHVWWRPEGDARMR